MGDYLLALSAGGQAPSHLVRLETLARDRGLRIRSATPNLFLAGASDLGIFTADEGHILVLGDIYRSNGAVRLRQQDIGEKDRQALLDMRRLHRNFWGNFIAISPGADRRDAILSRAPFGRLPCYFVAIEGTLFASNCTNLLTGAGLTASVHAPALVTRLAFRGLPLRDTCLEGVRALRGGAALSFGPDGYQEDVSWSAWDHAGRQDRHSSPLEASAHLRRVIIETTRAIRDDARAPLLMLSGGLDSSVLAASLSSLGSGLRALNLVRRDASGDERRYARSVAESLGIPLYEAEWSLDDIDVTHSASHAAPSPASRTFMQATSTCLARTAREHGCDLTLDGGGGDNVFCAMNSVAPVCDAVLKGHSLEAALDVAGTIAANARESIVKVLWLATRRALRRSPAYRWSRDLTFLNPEVQAMLPADVPHPWLRPPASVSPGFAAQVAVLAVAQGWAEEGDLVSPVRHASPLASLPVVRACLDVPIWWWFKGRRSRILAREAFKDRLPPDVYTRQSKGSPDGFVAEVYLANRAALREMLLDGHLRRLGLLDPDAIETATRSNQPVRGVVHERILFLAQAEAWLGSWS
ncbi:asparagine synthetase B family protein [Novosphingobium profundi]|uniref:asparagine synthase-related protein n=1 Tax=Novosphingobium profundi TaxID=1774954 RepID=UPI001BDB1981|nr:asparagine synthase-related protein [Novosphingobium profundi]MBT0670623.1 asparagine synthetase B family protein [Novosphingobium profundi]